MTSTDTSTSAYIARIQGDNIVAAVVGNTPAGKGYQRTFALAKIISVLETGPPPPPTNLNLVGAVDVSGGRARINWTNNITNVADTIIEINPGTGWSIYPHTPLLNANTILLTGLTGGVQVRVSTLSPQNNTSVPSNIIFIFISSNPLIPDPSGLATENFGSYGTFRITWVNNAPDVIDTIMEINGTLFNPLRYDPNSPFYAQPAVVVDTWPIYPHAPLGNVSTLIVPGYEMIEPRIYSVTAAGISNVVYLAGSGT